MKLLGLARLGSDAVTRYTPQGDAVANLSLAYNYGRKDQSGRKPTQWVEASLWGERAEKLAEWLTKGRLLYVEIEDLHIEHFEGRNGPGTKLVGRVSTLEFAGGGEQQQGSGQRQDAPQRNAYAEAKGRAAPRHQPPPQSAWDDVEDDIPF